MTWHDVEDFVLDHERVLSRVALALVWAGAVLMLVVRSMR